MTDPIKIDIQALPYNKNNNDTSIINNVKVKLLRNKTSNIATKIR